MTILRKIPLLNYLFFLFVLGGWGCILYPASPVGSAGRLTFEGTVSQQDVFQVFWAAADEGFSSERSSTVALKPGRSTYELKLAPLQFVETIRIDPVVESGDLTLHSLSLFQDNRSVIHLTTSQDFQVLQAIHNVKVLSLGDTGLQVRATAEDPQLLLAVHRPGWEILILQKMFFALLLALCSTGLYALLHSSWYRIKAGSNYPLSNSVHLRWGILSLCSGIFLVVVLPINASVEKSSLYLPAVAGMSAVAVYLTTFWLGTRPLSQNRIVQPTRWSWLWYALPSYCIWSLYLLAFWPGSMSPDSLDQWRQVLAGITHFKDWHPAFHTLMIWLLTRIWLSPTIVVLAQIMVLGGVAGWCLSVLQRWGVPRAILWITALIFAGWLVNGLMVITLWKDIAYSVAMLALTMILFQLVMSRGQWLNRMGASCVLIFVLFSVAIYRHNGIIPAIGLSLVLPLVFPVFWKKISIICLLALLLLVAVRGPLYTVMDVKRGNPLQVVYAENVQKIVSLLSSKKEEQGVEIPVKAMNRSGTAVKTPSAKKQKPQYGPVEDRLLSSSILWRVLPLEGFFTRIDFVNMWGKYKVDGRHIKYISSNKMGLDEASLMPKVMTKIFAYFEESKKGMWGLLWRPAIYLYVFFVCIAVAGYRLKSWKILLLTSPIILNSLPTLFHIIHKSIFRYHYSIILVSLLLSLPLLFINKKEVD